MNVLITGADGFIGKNLQLLLKPRSDLNILSFTKKNNLEELSDLISKADFIVHLAGINRTEKSEEFNLVNTQLTEYISSILAKLHKKKIIPLILASTTHVKKNTLYGQTKLKAENTLLKTGKEYGIPIYIIRLTNVFGKFCRPNYNSAVATFCHNINRSIPIRIDNKNTILELVYIDDVIKMFLKIIDGYKPPKDDEGIISINPTYKIKLGELVAMLLNFKKIRENKMIENIGGGFSRALYSTFISYTPKKLFTYPIKGNIDERGIFVEFLKTHKNGQVSFFTAHPGITRGGHYHNTKTEKFLVISGKARFRFKHVISEEEHVITTDSKNMQIVDSIPGWSHDIKNIGNSELIVIIWVNEIFDPQSPDTFPSKI